ncbi:MAG: DNA polymerase III subunit delta [Bacteroidales bacterium]|nr:DNA polymerase III subunit delta [Bacteroidales bacterium]
MFTSERQILESLKKKIFNPVYFLYGEEPYYIDTLTAYLEQNALEEADRDFNQTVVYGRDTTPREIIDQARRFPMMSNYLLIIVKEAQDLGNIELLEPYLQAPSASTILVINYKYKKLDKRKSTYKLLSKSQDTVLFESAKLYDNQIPDWISDKVRGMGFTISPGSALLLSEYLGNDLSRISNELKKLMINLGPGDPITSDNIEQNIGISKEFNIFELTKALSTRDAFRAFRIIQYFEANPKQNSLFLVIPMIHSFFMKVFLFHQISSESKNIVASKLGINPFFYEEYRTAAKNYPPEKLKQIITQLHELDLKCKGVGLRDSTSYGPLKDFTLQILS